MALKGIRVIEVAGLAPAPFCGMILSDFGASVIRVDKIDSVPMDRLGRGKRSIALDLKSAQGLDIVHQLCKKADVLIEPFRPGVMEKIGLGPERLTQDNPKLIYARLTGFGQNGPFSQMAGHDINYVALSGMLSMLGRTPAPPIAPLNLLADFAGGGLLCALAVVMALFERSRSNLGQVIDASMVEGAAYVGSWIYKSRDLPVWGAGRGQTWFDGGLHFYETYETKDGKYMSVGAIEPKFYAEFLKILNQHTQTPYRYPQFPPSPQKAKEELAAIFAQKTQQEWSDIFAQSDACVVPVLSLDEAPKHAHNAERNSFIYSEKNENYEPNPAPILSRTPAKCSWKEPVIGQHTTQVLRELEYKESDIRDLIQNGIVSEAQTAKL